MLKVGMTGGIASGKTQAADLFAKLGCHVIDTDIIAHQLVEIGTTAWQAIVDRFGLDILNINQTLNRKQLQQIIFNDTAEKKWLEALLHPTIRHTVQQVIEQTTIPTYCLIIIPLLVETLPNPHINRILVIDTEENKQIQRTIQRDNLSQERAETIIANQASRQQRLAVADDIIENNSSLANLQLSVQKMHSFYLSLAQNAT